MLISRNIRFTLGRSFSVKWSQIIHTADLQLLSKMRMTRLLVMSLQNFLKSSTSFYQRMEQLKQSVLELDSTKGKEMV